MYSEQAIHYIRLDI